MVVENNPVVTPNAALMGAEAMARHASEEYVATHYDCYQYGDAPPVQYETIPLGTAAAPCVVVCYSPQGGYGYCFMDTPNGLLGTFPNRAMCLMALEQRAAVMA